jgi:hypothetical protein
MVKPGSPSAGKRAVGVALMLLGVALIGYGTHYVTRNGSCSGTGYVSYGPVPKCGGNEALYIMSVFFLGPGLAIVGWVLIPFEGVLWPATCVGVGVGMITLGADPSATAGTKSFGVAAGVIFLALAVLSVVITVRKRLRPKPAFQSPAGLAAAPVLSPHAAHPPASARPPGTRPANPFPPGAVSPDPLDRIAKLAQLRDSGALTNEEFEAQKAKLLAEM